MVLAILEALCALPPILKFFRWAVEQIQSAMEIAERKKALEAEAKAAELAKKTKDTSGLEDVFDPKK